MRSAVHAAMFLSLAGLTSCATVMDGHTQMVSVQALKNDVISVDASCVVSNKQGSWNVETPGNVTVDRGRGKLNVACTAPGYLASSVAIPAMSNQDSNGNILIGGAVGTIVDLSDGAAYQYPNEIYVPMQPVPPPAPVAAVPSAPARS